MVELETDFIRCRTERGARLALEAIRSNAWAYPSRLLASVACFSNPPSDSSWVMVLDHTGGDEWSAEEADAIWLSIAPFVQDGEALEFRDEDNLRWRIRWESGKVFEELIAHIEWRTTREIGRS